MRRREIKDNMTRTVSWLFQRMPCCSLASAGQALWFAIRPAAAADPVMPLVWRISVELGYAA